MVLRFSRARCRGEEEERWCRGGAKEQSSGAEVQIFRCRDHHGCAEC